jgi:exodeoxyribonuclease VII large subunit
MTPRVLPVGAFVFFFRELLEADPLYSDLWLEGEVTNYSRSSAGHIYFNLSDEDGTLKCVLFRREALRQHQLPQLGVQVAVHGTLSIFPRSGSVQLQTDIVRPAGLGAAWLEVERLRQQLEAEGIFDPLRKRPLPSFPRSIGVVTSPYGAAWHDIHEVIRRRYPATRLVLSPAQVQGATAAASIVSALAALQDEPDVDLLILARGGGATDDLSPFNDERVVRAVFASRKPVVVGIGHAMDRTLVEEAADLVAPTPSSAAELSVPSAPELRERLDTLDNRLATSTRAVLAAASIEEYRAADRLRMLSPHYEIASHRTSVTRQSLGLRQAFDRLMGDQNRKISLTDSLLRALSPEAALRRGLAYLIRDDDGTAIFSASSVLPGNRFKAVLADGVLHARVEAQPDAADRSVLGLA